MELKTVGAEAASRLRGAAEIILDGATARSDDGDGSGGGTTVGQLARHEVASVSPKATLSDVIEALVDGDVGVVTVIDESGTVGVVSERDVIDAIFEGADPTVVWAADVMRTDLIAVEESVTVAVAGLKMYDEGVRHLLVGDSPHRIVSMRDIVGALVR